MNAWPLKPSFMFRSFALAACVIACMLARAGAWGEGSFENDDAVDWASECARSTGVKMVAAALDTAIKAKHLEAGEGSAAIVAAEVVAAAIGKPNAKLPKELNAWMRRQSKAELQTLVPMARQALRKVLDPKASELKQLWSEGRKNRWESSIAELEMRLAR